MTKANGAKRTKPDAATLRKLAVEASCDPRTILATLDGRTKRGLAYERARAALVAAGFDVPGDEAE